MTLNFQRIVQISFLFILLISCRINKDQAVAVTPDLKPTLVNFVDSLTASKLITTIDDDGLFEQISTLDIEIQMKREQSFPSRANAIKEYKNFLSTEVASWTDQDIEILTQIFTDAKRLCDTISPRIFPGGIKLIKIKTNHYGPDVYYTKGDIILIPENIFPINNPENILRVMLHEIFHIVSRQNPELKNEIYRLIGFEKAQKPVKLNKMLSDKLLTNPDGVSYQFFIQLDSILAIPLITSKFGKYRSQNASFFNHLQFDIYQLQDKGNYYEAITDDVGNTTIPLKKTPIFFTKIKDNTQYIIHPDEIMADNFMLAVLAYSNNEFDRFSENGASLLFDLLRVLQRI